MSTIVEKIIYDDATYVKIIWHPDTKTIVIPAGVYRINYRERIRDKPKLIHINKKAHIVGSHYMTIADIEMLPNLVDDTIDIKSKAIMKTITDIVKPKHSYEWEIINKIQQNVHLLTNQL